MDTGSNETWDKNVDNGFQLLELFDFAILCHKLDLALNFVPISVVHPLEKVDHYSNGLPDLVHDHAFCVFLDFDRPKVDVQEGH